MKVQILTTPGCSNCSVAEKWLDEIGISYEIIDVTEKPEFLQKYPVYTAPGIVINEKLEFAGLPNKKKFIEKINSLMSSQEKASS